jgi:hypothetical protein
MKQSRPGTSDSLLKQSEVGHSTLQISGKKPETGVFFYLYLCIHKGKTGYGEKPNKGTPD